MKPAILIGAAVVAVVAVAAIAFAATGGGSNNSTPTPSPTPSRTPTLRPTHTPAATTTPSGALPATATVSPPVQTPPAATAPPGDTAVPPAPTLTPPQPTPTLEAGRHPVPAPINEADVRVAESFPPQYFVHIQAGLPNGCAQQYTHSFTRSGNQIDVTVLNSMPDADLICTAIYGTYEINIGLGSDFVAGETYTVNVNDGAAEAQFTAQ